MEKTSAVSCQKLAMKTIIALVLVLAFCGCTSRTIEFNGARYRSVRFGNKETLGGIKVSTDPNGKTVFEVQSFQSDQVQALDIAVKAAVSAAIKSVAPIP